MLNGKSVLITGGTGSFGKAFVKTVLTKYPDIRRLVVFSRDELKQFEMVQRFVGQAHSPANTFCAKSAHVEQIRRKGVVAAFIAYRKTIFTPRPVK